MTSGVDHRGRLTPTVGVLIGLLLILLTASGCQHRSTDLEAFLRPPLEETAGRDASARVSHLPHLAHDSVTPPTAAGSQPAFVADAAEPRWADDSQPIAATPPATRQSPPTSVVWTTEDPARTAEPDETELFVASAAERGDAAAAPMNEASASSHAVDVHGHAKGNHPEADRATLPMFYVFGEVEHPGPYKHTGRNRVLDVISQVQPTRAANPARVLLLRPAPPAASRRLVIDVDRMIREGDLSYNVVLEAGDILYVPANAQANFGHAIGAFFAPKRDKAGR